MSSRLAAFMNCTRCSWANKSASKRTCCSFATRKSWCWQSLRRNRHRGNCRGRRAACGSKYSRSRHGCLYSQIEHEMKILVIGGGGREHALAWKLKQSPEIDQMLCAPGNAGTAAIAENVAITATILHLPDALPNCNHSGGTAIGLTVVAGVPPVDLNLVAAATGVTTVKST